MYKFKNEKILKKDLLASIFVYIHLTYKKLSQSLIDNENENSRDEKLSQKNIQ